MEEKKIFLLDALALIYRAHFAFIKAPRITSKGLNTSAVFGFVNTLLDILSRENPSHLAVAFDTHAPTFRHIEYPEYKAQREEMPEDIRVAIPLTKKLLKALNIPILEVDGFEADDVIGTIAHRAEKHGYKVYMVTSDKDYAQLVTPNVFLYKPAANGNGIEIYDPAQVREKYGVLPERIIDFLGLKGDAVDNIPGIPKIGDKTAISLIEEFGTVEEIIRRADEITKSSIQATVKENAEKGLLSKRLATISIDAPIPWDENDCKVGDPNKDDVMKLLHELEFRNTATRILSSSIFGAQPKQVQMDLFGNEVASATTVPNLLVKEFEDTKNTLETRDTQYTHIKDEKALQDLIREIETCGYFCFDTETTSLDPMQAELIAVTISMKPGTAFMLYFPEKEDPRPTLRKLEPLFLSTQITKIGQNLKYDMLMLSCLGIHLDGPMFDTMLAHYLINPDSAHGMDAMAREILNYDPISISSLIGKRGKHQLTMRSVPVDKLLAYACEDADITINLKEKLEPGLELHGVKRVFDEVEMPLVPVLTEMEFFGVRIDEDALNQYSKELEILLLKVEKEIYTMAGVRFNINSPKQLGEVIFEKLQLAKGTKTKTGQYSTKEEVLVELADQHELPALILNYRRLGKLKSTYVDALPELVNPKTHRIHTTYSQAVAATGRLSSNNPNLQNIPIRTAEGREIRKAFIPEEGYLIMSADYSQVELRLMAAFSKDPNMIEAFQKHQDIHKATAARVFGVELDEVDSDMRSKAKMVNFGIIYGISAFGLAQRLKISRGEAKEIIDNYFAKYPDVKKYMDHNIKMAREKGYAETVMGRRRYLPDINSQNQTVRGFAERNAINTPVQGSAADLIKIAMIRIQAEMKERKLMSKMIMQVHDELVFEAHPDEVESLRALVREQMENAIPLEVPMDVEVGVGKNWLEAH